MKSWFVPPPPRAGDPATPRRAAHRPTPPLTACHPPSLSASLCLSLPLSHTYYLRFLTHPCISVPLALWPSVSLSVVYVSRRGAGHEIEIKDINLGSGETVSAANFDLLRVLGQGSFGKVQKR